MAERPLDGRRIAITRAEHQAEGIVARLRALGAIPIICPTIAIAPLEDCSALDAVLWRLEEYDWLVLTSVNGVRVLFERMAQLGIETSRLGGARIGAIGPATAAALAERGARVSLVPRSYVAEGLLEEIGDVHGARILLPRADIARETLAQGLRAGGAEVDEVAAYRTVPGPGAGLLLESLRQGGVDALTCTSSSTVRYLLDGLQAQGLERPLAVELLNRSSIVCIGPVTAETARAEGLRIAATAEEFTVDGVLAALVRLFGEPSAAR